MMPRCKWGAAAIQVRGQQLGLFNSQPNPTLFSSPVFPCLNPHLRGVEEVARRAWGGRGGSHGGTILSACHGWGWHPQVPRDWEGAGKANGEGRKTFEAEKSLRGAMREAGEEVMVHCQAGQGRARGAGTLRGGTHSREAGASHVLGCWVPASPTGWGAKAGPCSPPRGPDTSPVEPLASVPHPRSPLGCAFPPAIRVCLALPMGLLYTGAPVPLSLCPG